MKETTKISLWRRFVTIAQPYFFPRIPGGGRRTLLLMVMLLLALFGALFFIVTALVLTGSWLAPELTEKVAGGLLTTIKGVFQKRQWSIALGFIVLPAVIFYLNRAYLKTKRNAWFLLAIVLLLSLSVTGINVAFSYIGNFFTTALVKKNQEMSYLFVGVYFCGFLVGIPIVAFYGYVRDYMGMHWRKWMTNTFLDKYFSDRNYYDIEAQGEIDNPDQRMMEDIRSFTRVSLAFLLILLGSLMDLVSFTGILWSKSVLLVAVVLGYSFFGTLITALIGRRLVRLNFNQLRYEADFRYSLVHVRDNTESIAFYRGEAPERVQVGGRFRKVLRNFSLLIGWQRNLSFFTTAYSYLPVVLPFVILFPQYFGGEIEYGDMVQANFAFTQVYGAMSLIVSQIEQITGFAAGVQRLSTFSEVLEKENPPAGIRSEKGDGFSLSNVTLQTPKGGRTLLSGLSLALEQEDSLLIVGKSGIGKSSLLRAIAGLWSRGEGLVKRPPLEEIFFLPQKPYMLLGSLRQQLLYPRMDRDVDDKELLDALAAVRLPELVERMGGLDVELDWSDVLSLGEQQRLAFARLLLNQPRYAVLDEATSALDTENEASLYRQLQKMGIRYISVGHRPTILPFHNRVLDLQGKEHWALNSLETYLAKKPIETAYPFNE